MAIPFNRQGLPDMLRQRIITALIAGVLLLVVLFVLPERAARLVIALLFVAAAWEWSGFLSFSAVTGRYVYTALLTVSLMGFWWLVPDSISYQSLLFVAIAWWISALVWMFFYPTPIPDALGWICGALVLIPAYVALDWIYLQSAWLLLFMLAVVWSADIGAYFAGKKFGRVKLAPNISPGKTWEGVVGGLVAVSILAVIGSNWVDESLAVLIPFCLAISLLSIVGDLTVSMFKRHAGIKDSGSLFPGHGGLLDRIDSVTAASTLFAAGVAIGGIG
jgi:phosphatidate cytidylyltransferase